MKRTTLLVFGFLALAACNNSEIDSSENAGEQTQQSTVGGEKDEHGCLTAAGESWSEIKQSCLQIFDIGQRLDPIAVSDGSAVISAFILFDDDKSQLELFLPNEKKTIILDKVGEEVYQKDTLRFDAKEAALYVNNEKKYIAG